MITIPGFESLDGVRVRPFAPDADYPSMATLLNLLEEDEQLPPVWQADLLQMHDRWLPDFDPPRDRIMLEADGGLIGSSRVSSWREPDGTRLYHHNAALLPAWRGRGIERAICRHNERRLRDIAQGHIAAHEQIAARRLRAGAVPDTNPQAMAALVEEGYAPIRYHAYMARSILEEIPASPLPEGLEARPVGDTLEEARAIWDANLEAFRDHWGYAEPPPSAFEIFRQNPIWDRALSRVAWAKGERGWEVAGMVLIYVPQTPEARRRGHAETEQICVRRPWRKRGVASALIAMCLRALRDAGFREASLGVDTQNLSGALRLYEHMGYVMKRHYTLFDKSMD